MDLNLQIQNVIIKVLGKDAKEQLCNNAVSMEFVSMKRQKKN